MPNGITPRPIRTPATFYRRVHPSEEIVMSNGSRITVDKPVQVRIRLPAGETARVQQRAKPAEGV